MNNYPEFKASPATERKMRVITKLTTIDDIRASLAAERKMRVIIQKTTFKGNAPTVATYRSQQLGTQKFITDVLRQAFNIKSQGISLDQIIQPCT